MAFSPSTKHKTTASTFSSIVDATSGEFTESLTVSGVPVSTDPGTNAFSGALYGKVGSQSCPNNVNTVVDYDLLRYDVGGWVETPGDDFFTVPAGVSRVRMLANITFSSNQSGLRQGVIEIDYGAGFVTPVEGSPFDREDADGGGADVIHIVSYAMTVSPGDKLRVSAFQQSGTTLTMAFSEGAEDQTWCAIEAVEGGISFIGPIGATGPGASSFAGALIIKTDSQSIPHNTVTVINWQNEVYDVGEWFANSGDSFFTVPDGVFKMKVQSNLLFSGSTGSTRSLLIEIDSGGGFVTTSPIIEARQIANPTSEIVHLITPTMLVQPGDKVRVRAFQQSGVTLSTTSSEHNWIYIEAVDGGVGFTGVTGAQGVQGFTGVSGPAGNALGFQKFDTTHSPVALYNFEDDLTDSSGNGLDLTLTIGVERYTSLEGLRAFYFNSAEKLTHPAGTALVIAGDMTIEFLLVSYRTNLEMLLEYTADADSGTIYNTLYQVLMTTGHQLLWHHENSSQANFTYTDPGAAVPVGTLAHIAAVRSNNEITFYVDGQQAGATSAPLSAAFDGSSAILSIGARNDNSSKFLGAMASVKIINSALSGAEILAEYDRTIGDNRSRV